MAAPFIECTEEQQRSVIRFLWSKSVETSETYGRMTLHYGDNRMSQMKVYEWLEKFKGRQASVDNARSERSSTAIYVEVRSRSISISRTTG
jgi:hypothetical protein